jgi:hypothetical protein
MARMEAKMKFIWTRSRIGCVLATGYFGFFLFVLFMIAISPPDGMVVLVPMFLAMPWSFWLFEALPENALAGGGMGTFFIVLCLCALVNAALLYVFGFAISMMIAAVTKQKPRPI